MRAAKTLSGEFTEKTWRIGGLDCADCARKIEEEIRGLAGVEEAVLAFATGKLYLRYHGSPERVKQVVKAHGYSIYEDGERENGSAVAKRRTLFAILSALALLLAAVLALLPLGGTQLFLLIAIITGGHLTFRRGLMALIRRRLDMNTLMTVAVTGALLIGEWWEAAVVAFLFAASNALETHTTEKNRHSIRLLMDTVPETAHVLREGTPVTVPVDAVSIGEKVLVRPGEGVPLDGVVLSGSSYVSEAAVTGESLPAVKEAGSQVYAGTLNGNGSLHIRVEGTSQNSTVAKIVRLVEEAQARRAPAEQFVDRFARVYTPAVLALAVLIASAGPLLFGGGWQPWLYRGLALLIVACPCALVVSTPVSIVAALTNAARQGILVKGGIYLEQFGEASAIVFDKTGTLTKGDPAVTRITSTRYGREAEVLQLAASLEAHSEHPLAAAIRTFAAEKGLKLLAVENFVSYPGKGVTGTINGGEYLLGSAPYLEEQGVPATSLQRLAAGGETAVVLAAGDQMLGAVFISDTLRPESRRSLDALRALGVKNLSMLTGDRAGVAHPIAAQLGLDDVKAGLLPQEKEEAVRQLRELYRRVAMVGDGINDAPALAAADIGVAMGAAGSPTALETADIALMGDDLTKLPYLVGLSRQTMAVIRQNIVFALIIKTAALSLVFPGWLTLWLAILADMGASLIVTTNGMRLLTYRSPFPFDTSSPDIG